MDIREHSKRKISFNTRSPMRAFRSEPQHPGWGGWFTLQPKHLGFCWSSTSVHEDRRGALLTHQPLGVKIKVLNPDMPITLGILQDPLGLSHASALQHP